MTENQTGETLNMRQAAARLGVSPMRMRFFIENGKIGAQKIGGRWAVQTSDIDAMKATKRTSGRPITTGAGERNKKAGRRNPAKHEPHEK